MERMVKMTKHKRVAVSLPPDLEAKLYELRKTDQFIRMSFSEIMRAMFEKGVEETLAKSSNRPCVNDTPRQ